MPFMIGKSPVRRTIKYLEAGKLILKNSIQIFSVNYNTKGNHHKGLRDFVYWFLPQIQYKNPNVQVISFTNLTPSPFVTCFYDTGKRMIIDVDSKSKEEILGHLMKVVGKSTEELGKESTQLQKEQNPANFGVGCKNSCICTIHGQLPCPGIVPLPNHMRGKFIYAKD